MKKYKIHNLFRIKTGKESRLIYMIVAEGENKVVIILDFFPKHKDYERCFGY
jgi:mRNA-degrading endonuclease RelE of RelBE toxin-antitoxin system